VRADNPRCDRKWRFLARPPGCHHNREMRICVLALLAGCSFVGVRAPSRSSDPSTADPSAIRCNDSGLLPGLDALGGAAAIALTGGGILYEHTTDKADHFTKYYAGPSLALAILYFYSASFGTDRISRCSDLKERAAQVKVIVRPVDFDEHKDQPKPDSSGIEIE